MQYKLLDVTNTDGMPELPEEIRHAIMGMTMQRGKVFVAIEGEETPVVCGLLGVFPSYTPESVEIGMMYTFGEATAITKEFIEHILSETGAQSMRCQMSDENSRSLVNGLGFVHESTIFGTDMLEESEGMELISIAGKGYDYLSPEMLDDVRMLIRVGGAEEASFTQQPYTPTDEDIDGMLETVKESMVDMYVRVVDGRILGLLAIEPNMQAATITCCVVHPEHRLNGIARAMVNRAVRDYVKHDDHLVLATILEATPHLKEFVESVGMHTCASIHRYTLSPAKVEVAEEV